MSPNSIKYDTPNISLTKDIQILYTENTVLYHNIIEKK